LFILLGEAMSDYFDHRPEEDLDSAIIEEQFKAFERLSFIPGITICPPERRVSALLANETPIGSVTFSPWEDKTIVILDYSDPRIEQALALLPCRVIKRGADDIPPEQVMENAKSLLQKAAAMEPVTERTELEDVLAPLTEFVRTSLAAREDLTELEMRALVILVAAIEKQIVQLDISERMAGRVLNFSVFTRILSAISHLSSALGYQQQEKTAILVRAVRALIAEGDARLLVDEPGGIKSRQGLRTRLSSRPR